jgi:hypothetical protein
MESSGVARKSVARIAVAASMCLLSNSMVCVHAQATQKSVRDTAIASTDGSKFTIGNSWIQVQGSASAGKWNGLRIIDRATPRSVDMPDAFSLAMKSGSVLSASSMKRTQPFVVHNLRPEPDASRYSDRLPGKEVCTEFNDPTTAADVEWCGIVRDGSNYFRQQITIHTSDRPLPITDVSMLQFKDPGARVVGSVKGSPIVDNTMFFGFEHPLSTSQVHGDEVLASLSRTLPMQPHQSIVYSSVVGVAAPGQMRRDFLRYIERERAHPYRPSLQYNTWYDLGYNNRTDETGALNRIHAFGTQLTEKRGAVVTSFVFDDGWDNPNSLWGFDSGFPDGFKKASEMAAQYHSHIGVWMSPWGGYEQQKLDRIAFGKKHGYEIVSGGFALSGPKYFAKFEDTCLNMIHAYDANEFKFDGTGNADRVFPGSEFDSDFDAMLALIHRLRQVEPNIFINLSTGTYPSPFWLFDTDDIWRGGEDHSFTGVGTSRQRWITYRDSQVYKNIVEKGPLFPINSLMLHGMIFAQYADGLKTDPKEDFRDEVETFFGSGTQVQEMYITPSLLSSADWDILAKGARWSLDNAETLKDVHWIGGDPQQLQVYGWASWSPRKAIIVLRNPSDKPQTFSLDIQTALELPAGSARTYTAHDPWTSRTPAPTLHAGDATQIRLQPWEVRTLEAMPSGRQ